MPKRKERSDSDVQETKKQPKQECSYCRRVFTHLSRHVKNVHGIGTVFHPCHVCGREFKDKTCLKSHVLNVHGSGTKRLFKCTMCELSFKRKPHLKSHMQYVHDVEVQFFPCSQCEKKFKTMGAVRKHVSYVHDNKELSCPLCSKVYKHQSYLDAHVKQVHLNEFELIKCKYCDKDFKRKSTMKYHVKQFHSENPEMFPCPKCQRLFNDKGNLKQHMAFMHGIGTKFFPCKLCEFECKRKTNLEAHVQRMHDIGDFECSFCFSEVSKLTPYKDVNGQTSDICQRCFQKVSGRKSRAEEAMLNALKLKFGPFLLVSNKVLKGEKCITRSRPDAYFHFPNLHLFVECDEHQHRREGYTSDCEKGRMCEQCDEFEQGHKVFIRWNPDRFRFDPTLHKLPKPKNRQDRIDALLNYISNLLQNFDYDKPCIPEVHYIFYDKDNPMIVPSDSEEFRVVFS